MGTGPPLLLIHGLGYARWGWEPVVEPLARSFDVILFDNRGVGESDAPPGPYTAAEMAGDALQVLDEAGVERAHVRRDEPRRDGRAGARARASRAGRQARPGVHDARRAERVPDAAANRRADAGSRHAPPVHRERARARSAAGARRPDPGPSRADGSAVRALGGAGRGGCDVRCALPPRLAGDADARAARATATLVVDPRNSDLLVEAIPDARLSVYEGAGHLFMWQEPERFVAELEEFLC